MLGVGARMQALLLRLFIAHIISESVFPDLCPNGNDYLNLELSKIPTVLFYTVMNLCVFLASFLLHTAHHKNYF